MSKSESRRRRNRRRKAYRRAMMIARLVTVLLSVIVVIIGLFHVFTNKKEYRDKGIALYEQGKYQEAVEYFDKALRCNQWFSDAVNVDIELYKADCYMRMEDYISAGETYSGITTKYSKRHYNIDDINYLVSLCATLDKFSNGDYVSTVANFVKAVDRGYTEISIYAAICYENQHNYEKMKAYYDIYTRNFGMDSYLYYKYASYYIVQEDYDTASNYITQGLAAGDSTYLRQLKYAQIKCNEKMGNYDYAYELAKEYISEYPEDKNGMDMYAYLETRVKPDTNPVNDIFEIGTASDTDASEE